MGEKGAKPDLTGGDLRIAVVVDAMGPKRGVALQGTTELIGPERARLTPVRKFSWGL